MPIHFSGADVFPAIPLPSEDFLAETAAPLVTQWLQQIPSSGTNIGVFVFELKDLKELIPKLEGSLLAIVENGFLNFEFGLGPFIQDLKTLNGIVTKVNDRIDYLKKTYGQRVRLTQYIPNVEGSYDPNHEIYRSYATGASDPYGFPLYHAFYVVECRSDFRINAYQRQKLEGLDSAQGVFKAFLAALGLNNLAKTVWQGLSFSFIVDWFLHIGSTLDSLNAQPFDGDWAIEDVTWSCKTHYKLRVITHFTAASGTSGVPSTKVSMEYEGTHYQRGIGIPAKINNFDLSSLDPTELALLFSLVHRGLD
jgi:hypothetical protein